ncbi:FAD-binding protein [Nocardiopsis sp. NRRL B-16309]|uniref:FAD-binding protein n=1 Tax=Nocardiopsis sp. NRRL B-16309 TaxID=1519494 RepID=UPI001E5EB9EC|nr:FAD-binding protein [Nocardiopsis sp. NRRL B-16309]
MSRRTLLAGLGAGVAATGFDPLTRAWADDGSLAEEDRAPGLDGELVFDEESLAAAADDFGHAVSRYPRAVLRPGSVRDVERMVRYCRARRIPVAARGQAHSTRGQAQVEEGLVIETATLDHLVVSDDRAEVGAGVRWSQVLSAALPYGLTPPVLTDYLELSVGGTLAVGGVGGTTQHHGLQVDTVVELDVVTGEGRRRRCSPETRADLFHMVLGGLGQCAVIVGATVRLAPAPETVRQYHLYYDTVEALTADQRLVLADGRFDYLEGQAQSLPEGGSGWRFMLEGVAFHEGSAPPDDDALLAGLSDDRADAEIVDLPYLDFADRLAPAVEFLKSIGAWYDPHPWWNVFVPGDEFDALAASALADLTQEDIGPTGVVLMYPLRRELLGTTLPRVPDEPVVFLFALLKTATPAPGVPDNAAMVDANRVLYERVRDVGGFQYPVGSIPMDRADWRAHFGPVWDDFAAARAEYDPAGILAPGQGIFD